MKPYKEVFNDGLLKYGHKVTRRSETGKRIGEDFNEEGSLYFQELSCRDSDYLFANSIGSSLDLKVKTLYPPSFKNLRRSKLKVYIRGAEYDVIKVDSDMDKTYLYFYLQEVGDISE